MSDAASFDDRAATWDDDPGKVARARDAADHIRAEVALTPETRVLEYGAGTGLLSQHLAADVGPITLAEPSTGMREVLAAKVADGRLPGARIWALDLAADPAPAERFDLLVTLMTLHHIPDLAPVLRGFRQLIADDGALCVLDLDHDTDRSFHDPDFTGHPGFVRADLADQLRTAGFETPRFSTCHTISRGGGEYDVFLACTRPVAGTRPTSDAPDTRP